MRLSPNGVMERFVGLMVSESIAELVSGQVLRGTMLYATSNSTSTAKEADSDDDVFNKGEDAPTTIARMTNNHLSHQFSDTDMKQNAAAKLYVKDCEAVVAGILLWLIGSRGKKGAEEEGIGGMIVDAGDGDGDGDGDCDGDGNVWNEDYQLIDEPYSLRWGGIRGLHKMRISPMLALLQGNSNDGEEDAEGGFNPFTAFKGEESWKTASEASQQHHTLVATSCSRRLPLESKLKN